MKKLDPNDLKPCSHMRGLVSAHIDGKLGGVADWYTRFHIKGCAQCSASIPFLVSLKSRLSSLDTEIEEDALGSDRHAAIDAELAKIDSATQNV
jgi:hypothetical protein